MTILLTILIIIVCLLLCVTVLIQNSKGGGLAEGMGSVTQVAGVKASSEIEKITWGLIITLVVLCLISTINVTSSTNSEEVKRGAVQEYIDENGAITPDVDVNSLPSPSASDINPAPQQ